MLLPAVFDILWLLLLNLGDPVAYIFPESFYYPPIFLISSAMNDPPFLLIDISVGFYVITNDYYDLLANSDGNTFFWEVIKLRWLLSYRKSLKS